MNKRQSVFSLVTASLITCLSCILIYAVPIIPTGKLSAFQCVILIECGKRLSFISGVVCSIFIMLFGTNKFIAVGYVCIFAFYPVLKSFFESARTKVTEWIYKFVYYAVASFVVPFVLKSLNLTLDFPIYLYIGAIVILSIFDVALSFFISYYIERILPLTAKISKRKLETLNEEEDI